MTTEQAIHIAEHPQWFSYDQLRLAFWTLNSPFTTGYKSATTKRLFDQLGDEVQRRLIQGVRVLTF